MDLSAAMTGAGSFTLAITSTDNVGGFPGWSLDLSGTHSGISPYTFTTDYYLDANNGAFGTTTLLGSLGGTSSDPLVGTMSSAYLGNLVEPYSITMIVGIEQKGGTTTINIDMEPVPEPATVALLGLGLVGLATGDLVRRRRKKVVVKS